MHQHSVVELVAGGDSGVTGKLHIVQGFGNVHITGQIYGLKPGLHGFHVHMNGDLGDNCKAAGGHFNPDEVICHLILQAYHALISSRHPIRVFRINFLLQNEHSSPVSRSRHAGDLGNIFTQVLTVVTYVSIKDTIITLGDGGARDIAGKAIVVHAGEDDLGRGVGDKAEGSKKTGNAGGRVACGLITLV